MIATPSTEPANVRRGAIFWIQAPSPAEGVASPAHPHVVIQDDVFNRSRIDTVVVCAVSSNLNRMNEPGNVLLDVGEGDLPKQSVLIVSQVSSVKRVELGAYIGMLSAERVDQILNGMRFQQASFFGER